MLNILRADFYKLVTRKSFYICGIIAAALGILGVILMNTSINMALGVDAKSLGYDGIVAIQSGLSNVTLLVTVILTMFISSEFSYGTIKNMASRGIGRVNIYLSKLAIGIFTVLSYTVVAGLSGFAAGAIMWGPGEFTQETSLNILKMLGLFLLAEIAFQSVFMMLSFLIRHVGGAISVNVLTSIFVTSLLLPVLDFSVDKMFDYTLDSTKYWVGTYTQDFLSLRISDDVMKTGIIVCLIYLAVSTVIGIFTFQKRDIK